MMMNTVDAFDASMQKEISSCMDASVLKNWKCSQMAKKYRNRENPISVLQDAKVCNGLFYGLLPQLGGRFRPPPQLAFALPGSQEYCQ